MGQLGLKREWVWNYGLILVQREDSNLKKGFDLPMLSNKP